jgi:hypothetical protein
MLLITATVNQKIASTARKTDKCYVCGKCCGTRLEHSVGAGEKSAAKRIFGTWKRLAKKCGFKFDQSEREVGQPTFASAAVRYIAGGDGQYLESILFEVRFSTRRILRQLRVRGEMTSPQFDPNRF